MDLRPLMGLLQERPTDILVRVLFIGLEPLVISKATYCLSISAASDTISWHYLHKNMPCACSRSEFPAASVNRVMYMMSSGNSQVTET